MSASQATVYLVTNIRNGHEYVGVTRFTPEVRWAQHVEFAKRLDTYLARAIRHYGADAFTIAPVASCLSCEDGRHVERAIIQRIRPAYNQTNGGEFTIGRTFTADVRAKMSASHKALGRHLTPQQRAAMECAQESRLREQPELARENVGRGGARARECRRD